MVESQDFGSVVCHAKEPEPKTMVGAGGGRLELGCAIYNQICVSERSL